MNLARLNSAFRHLGIASDVSENQGILAGLLCARGPTGQDVWLELLRGEAAVAPGAADAAGREPQALSGADSEERALVEELYRNTVTQLQAPDLVFQLLLPGDEQPLGLRTEALADWCRGFLFGLGAGGVEDYALLPEDVREITQDMIEISRAQADADHDEADEVAYMELTEYLRAGVMLVFEELEAERGSANEDKVIH